MKKVISFCLWGINPKYCVGAIRNAELAPKIYPGWECWFYIADSVPKQYIDQLSGFSHVKLIPMPPGFDGWRGMFARFLPASDPSVEIFISRDCDSRLNEREAAAVNEWLNSSYFISCIQDHPYHLSRIMLGGMWGAKKGICSDIKDLIYKFIDKYSDSWDIDQDFLQSYILPKIKHAILLHSDFCGKRIPYNQLPDGGFIGEIFDEYNNPNLQHRIIRLNYDKT